MTRPHEPGSGRVPDFFIVGQPKSGTTALYEMLRSHPQIFMPELKEPLFFASDLRPPVDPQELEAGRKPLFPATWEEYEALFEAAAPDQRVGEATPTYLRSRVAAGAIAEAQPSARIVAIFREPASFLRSLHLQWLQEHLEIETDLADAMALEDSRREGVLRPGEKLQARTLLYSELVCYVEQLRRFQQLFPPEQIMTLIYDDFRRDNDATVRSVLRFLEVDDSVQIETTSANPTVAVRSRRLERMVRRAQAGQGPISGPARSLITTVAPPDLRRKLFNPVRKRLIYGKPQAVDERLVSDLRRRFKPEVEALSEHLGRDLVALWGYDSID
jgi:Sulfotransferase family